MKKVFKTIGIISIVILIMSVMIILIFFQAEQIDLKKFCNPPTETIKINNISSDYKELQYDYFLESDYAVSEWGVTNLCKNVYNTNLYTVSEDNNILVNLEAYSGKGNGSKIYVKNDQFKSIPISLSNNYIQDISLMKYEDSNGTLNKHYYYLELSDEQIEKAMDFFANEKYLIDLPESISIPNIYNNQLNNEKIPEQYYSICYHVKGLDGLYYYSKYYCAFNEVNGKFYLKSRIKPNTIIYDIPNEYQEIIKFAVDKND